MLNSLPGIPKNEYAVKVGDLQRVRIAPSAAAKSGIRSGDAILKVADIETGRTSLFELRRILRAAGTTVRVAGTREGKDYDVLIALD
jgi:C-terminal processing protease CtpA/Prc